MKPIFRALLATLALVFGTSVAVADNPACNPSVGYQPHELTAADAAAVNAYLLPEYYPRHVSAGDVFATINGCMIDIPVLAPVGASAGSQPSWVTIEISVPIPRN